ncbi:DUF397 domain-containing protein [Actinomadura sp. 1N219]|uniref:DUF397 domain-containing protein n=1 Tax=Actinomadura sp. 1N219 TaxID=3375152 RepID=UPI0037A72823
MIQWRKSSHSQGGHGECVEISTNTSTSLIRDSKDPDGPQLALRQGELATLISQIKDGDLDLQPPL